MRIAITGVSGFIGSHIAERLLADGHRVVGIDTAAGPNLAAAAAHPQFELVTGDIRDADFVNDTLDRSVDAVFHLAAVVGVHKYMANPFDVIDINVIGSRHVLGAAARFGTRVLLTSTSEVFGKNPAIPWAEDDDRVLGSTAIDRWSYSTSKATLEHLGLAVHRQGLAPVTIVRYFNAYGPRQSPIFVISRAIHRVLNGLAPVVYDGGTQTRCFTFIDDAVAGTIAAAFSPAAEGEIFNLGNTTEVSVAEATHIVLEEAGVDIEWEAFATSVGFGERYQDIDRRVPSADKAAELLGWRADTQLREGVRRTLVWARSQPAWLGLSSDTTVSAAATTES